MDELIKQVSQKSGLSQESARKSVMAEDAYLREKLPPQIYHDVEILLATKDVTEEQKRELGLFQIP
jgi:hypothetical protein